MIDNRMKDMISEMLKMVGNVEISNENGKIEIKAGQISVTISDASPANEKPAEQKKRNLDEPFVDVFGNKSWYNENDQLHRENDLPAVIFADGTQHWYKNGLEHRDGDLPAIISQNKMQVWYKNGKKHRDGGLPAIIYQSGRCEWFHNGHCYLVVEENGKATIYKENLAD
jgi:hypothetical protein